QLRPQGLRQQTVPTELERRGDFSQSVDRDGNPFPYIRDYTLNLPCSATETRGCFRDGGVLGRIPQNRLYAPSSAILNIFPLPNAQSTANRGFNFRSQIPDSYPRREDMVRIDYNASDTLRIYGRFIYNFDSITSNYGSFVLGANIPVVPITDARPGKALVLNVTKTINPTTINEVVVGFGKNQIDIFAINNGLTRSATGLSNLPALYPGAIQDDYVPQFGFGGRINNGPNIGTNNAPFFNFNRTIDIVDNFSKLFGKHALKTGVYFQRSQKDQTSFAPANGTINFNDNTGNPFDTGFAFANAATGVYNTFTQASQYATGQYRYTNLEFYVQDNWKATRKLTLDYGMRFYYIQPQYDASLQTSTFIPERFDPARAVRLYRPARVSGQNVAIDPLTGQTTSSVNVGRIVPGSGDILNGIVQAGKGIEKGLIQNRGIHYAPRFGFAYDVTGERNIVVRGGGGIFYDRFQGNEVFAMLTNPPTTTQTQLQNGLFSQIDLRNALLPTPVNLEAFSYEGKIPTVYHFNVGVQTKLPYDFILDVSYVGSQSRHQLQRLNLNAVPYSATYRRENQNPTNFTGGVIPSVEPNLAAPFVQAGLSFSGTNSLTDNFLRPYQGYGNITQHQMGGTGNYNSMQVELNRRFATDLFMGVSYTWSRNMTTANGDGDFFRIDEFNRFANYGPSSLHRRHNLAVNAVYELPRLTRLVDNNNKALRLVGDGWQLSGIYRFQTGAPFGVGFSVPSIGNRELTGSNTEGARVRIIGNPGRGNSSDPYRQLDVTAFTAPLPGSRGLESGRNYLEGPGINNFDLSLQKTFLLGEVTRFELRVDAFNAFNHTQFSGVNSTLNVNNLIELRPTNLPFDAAGNLVNRNGFGTINGVRDPRILQMVARFQF
ncbi:MAG: hypothetical protein H0V18_02050, partial [Pyrinomonadaceae bacterium]|nr:hypothetical protein [Pyrinomonadaceae bacterium]